MPDGDVAQHTIEKPRVSRAPKPAAVRQNFEPSIEALARHEMATLLACDRVEVMTREQSEHSSGHRRCLNGEGLGYARERIIRDLIATLPARTMTDVVVQIGLLQTLIDRHIGIGATDPSEPEDPKSVMVDLRQAARLAASVFPVIVAAAQVDPTDLVPDWCLKNWEHHFGAVEQAMGVEA